MPIKQIREKKALAAVLAIAMVALSVSAPAANPTYNQAVADYNAGKYGQAASEFESIKASYPTNALTRYYLALTRQALGHYDKAREEYQWVATNGDARLRAMALQGMQRMSNTKSFVTSSRSKGTTPMAGDYIPPFANSSGSSSSSSSTQTNTHAGAKVTKILKFTAPWCGPCQAFLPIFDAVKSKFNDVTFEEVDFDTNQELKAKYSVTNIPHLVFLDAGGKVLFSRAGAPRSVESFERLVRSYH